MKTMNFISAMASVTALAWLPVNAEAVTTGLDFAGGCPEASTSPLCGGGSNANLDNVAAILGVNSTLVTTSADFSVTPADGTAKSGIWSIGASSGITHIAFKSSGYFILGKVTALSGTWDNADWDLSIATCPASICGSDRAYTTADFLNNGGQIADLSNARAFSVVPVPAAVWLFGSGLLGLVGVARRKRA